MDFGSHSADIVRGILAFITAVGALLGMVLPFVDSPAKKRKRMEAVPHSTPPPAHHANPYAAPPPTDPALLARLDKLEMRTGWDDERRALLKSIADKTQELRQCRAARQKLETQLRGKDQQETTLNEALARVTAERDELRRQYEAACTRERAAAAALPPVSDSAITPLRPPGLKGKP